MTHARPLVHACSQVVINIIGYDSAAGELHGISWDQRAFMLSDDGGATWHSVNSRRHQEVSAARSF